MQKPATASFVSALNAVSVVLPVSLWRSSCMAGIRERVEENDHPKAFEGFPFALITAGLMSIAFLGFQGLINVSTVVKAMGL